MSKWKGFVEIGKETKEDENGGELLAIAGDLVARICSGYPDTGAEVEIDQ